MIHLSFFSSTPGMVHHTRARGTMQEDPPEFHPWLLWLSSQPISAGKSAAFGVLKPSHFWLEAATPLTLPVDAMPYNEDARVTSPTHVTKFLGGIFLLGIGRWPPELKILKLN